MDKADAVRAHGRGRLSRRDEDPETERKIFLRRPANESVVVEVPALRIVPQASWDRVKTRQRERSEEIGTYVRNGLKIAKDAGDGRRGPRAEVRFLRAAQVRRCATPTSP